MRLIGTVTNKKPWIDYSNLKTLQSCPRQYYWAVKQNLRPAGPQPALEFGGAIHEAHEAYYVARIAGSPDQEARQQAKQAMLPKLANLDGSDPVYNQTIAELSLDRYIDTHLHSPNQPLWTELGFALTIGEFLFVGRVDRCDMTNFGRVIYDLKTSKVVGNRWDLRLEPNAQLDAYYAALSILTDEEYFGVGLDILFLHKDPSKAATPKRIFTGRTEQHVEAWLLNTSKWLDVLAAYEDSNVWPMNTETCNPLVGYSCRYQTICKKYPQPFTMSEFDLMGEYEQREWVPFEELQSGKEAPVSDN